MVARELMIGDWAKFKESKYPHKRGELICIKNHNEFELSHKLVPIPLTVEILESNGFVYQLGSWWLRSDLFTLNVFSKGGFCAAAFHKQAIIHYVHELQHALRICGLNDLADNLKI